MRSNQLQTQSIHTFCKVCESRLNTPEEWGQGLCASHASSIPSRILHAEPDWNAILEAIDASDKRDGRAMNRDS